MTHLQPPLRTDWVPWAWPLAPVTVATFWWWRRVMHHRIPNAWFEVES